MLMKIWTGSLLFLAWMFFCAWLVLVCREYLGVFDDFVCFHGYYLFCVTLFDVICVRP